MRFKSIRHWLSDFWSIAQGESKLIFRDWGVLLIFIVACLIYPLLYNLVYLNGFLDKLPIAVVDQSCTQASRNYIRSLDATRECKVAYSCISLNEAKQLMQKRKVMGIVVFPQDYAKKLADGETATISLYCDMSSFLYFKNCMIAVNRVMLDKMHKIQIQRLIHDGMSGEQLKQYSEPLSYQENYPYNRAFSYSFFLISTILLLIVQQTMFYGMSLLAGTLREQGCSFASIKDRLNSHGVGRIVLGRALPYWILYIIIGIYISMIVPAIFGIPQNGTFYNNLFLIVLFVTDCIFFCMFWSTFITKRESVFILFLFMSPVCLFLSGTSWPTSAFPKFWLYFSYLFPTSFGCKAYINTHIAGGDLQSARDQLMALSYQAIIYLILAHIAIYAENKFNKYKKKKIS